MSHRSTSTTTSSTRRSRTLLAAFALAGAAVIGTTAVALAGPSEAPPPGGPAWFTEDGQLDRSKAPEWLPVSDSTGATVGYARFDDLHAGPPPLVNGKPQRTPPVKVFSDEGGRDHVGWIAEGRFQRGTARPQ